MSKKNAPPQEMNQFVPAGLKWLAEMEAVNSPVLLNIIYGNIYSFPNVDNAEILIDKHNRKMLIWIHFNWSTRKFFKNRKKETTINILDQLQELLPSFEFRIIEDKALFDLAVHRMTQYVLGGKEHVTQSTSNNAGSNDADASSSDSKDDQHVIAATAFAAANAQAESTEAQSEAEPVHSEADSSESSED